MSYTIYDSEGDLKQIRLLGTDAEGDPEWKQAFTPTLWECDACALPSRRWRVIHSSGIETYYAWYEIAVVGEERAKDLVCKMARAAEIAEAYDELRIAQKKVHDLTR